MKKQYLYLITLLSVILVVSTSFCSILPVNAAEEEEEEWDFTGEISIDSDIFYRAMYNPIEDGGLNETINGYERPVIFVKIIGLDTDANAKMDMYIGLYGIITYDVDHLGYEENTDLFIIIMGTTWKLRIPEESPLHWEVLYYPNPVYMEINPKRKIPIMFINLTKNVGVNLEYQIETGKTAEIGNFTTFGSGNPLHPDVPAFPEYNTTVALYTDTILIGEYTNTGFFDSTLSFITIISLSFVTLYIWRKKRKAAK